MKQSSAMMVGVGKWENAVRMSVVVWVVVNSFVNLEPEIFFGSLLPEVAVVEFFFNMLSIYKDPNHIKILS